jgi:PPM family protein phosphatase
MRCPRCAAPNRADARFCNTCGERLSPAHRTDAPAPARETLTTFAPADSGPDAQPWWNDLGLAPDEIDQQEPDAGPEGGLMQEPDSDSAGAQAPGRSAAADLPTAPLSEADTSPAAASAPATPAAMEPAPPLIPDDSEPPPPVQMLDPAPFDTPDPAPAATTATAATAARPAAPQRLSPERATKRLDEAEAPSPAPAAPSDPFPPLAPGDVVAGRYEIQETLQTGPQRQTYLAADLQGYSRCWACGSRNNVQGEMYCTDCGAQLTGRRYRLLETPPDAAPPDIPAPLLENMHTGVAGVFESVTDPGSGRHYLPLEEVGGQPLSAFLTPAHGTEPPSPGRLLGWLSQAADTLRDLHASRVIGCDFTPEALYVLPDDRLVLADPTSCRMAGAGGDPRSPDAEAQADVQRVAAGLEQWYKTMRPDAPAPAAGDTSSVEGILAHGRAGGYRTAAEFAGGFRDLLSAAAPPRDLQLISGRATDVGVQRQLNEDSIFVLECMTMEAAGYMPTAVYVVADGMGGHDSGEVASSIAIRTIGGLVTGLFEARISGDGAENDREGAAALVRQAILEANRRITGLSRERHSDMGTTVTMALALGNQVTVANVGDSRTYLWRDAKLQQISQDHSLVARLVAAGQLSPDDVRTFERRNEIYRALGDPHLVADEIDIFNVTLRPLDALLLCSDGLWEMVRDEQITKILLEAPDPPAAAQALVDAANANGGEDNISVIIAQTLTRSED